MKNNFKYITIAILIVLILPIVMSAVKKLIFIQQETDIIYIDNEIGYHPPKHIFSLEELLEDYDQLWLSLRDNYIFFNIVERKGVNVEKVKQEGRDTIINRVTDVHGLAQVIKDVFFKMSNFAHLDFVDINMYISLSLLGESAPLKARDEAVNGEQTKYIYEYLISNSNNIDTNKIYQPEVKMRYFPNLNAAYFHFKSFSITLIDRDKNLIFDYLSTLPNVEHIIIDITGNHGGAWDYWINNIITPFGGEYIWNDYVFLTRSPINEYYWFNDVNFTIYPINGYLKKYDFPYFVDDLNLTHFFYRNIIFSPNNNTNKILESKATRWVLIDGNVYSSADAFAAFCKKTGWATLVGDITMGDGAKGLEPVIIALDNTGLLFRFTTAAVANIDGTLNTEIGTKPDIFNSPGELPLDLCQKIINQQINPLLPNEKIE